MSFAFPEEVGPGLPSARRSVSGLLRRRSRTVPATVEFREASESSRHSRQRVHETHDNKSVFSDQCPLASDLPTWAICPRRPRRPPQTAPRRRGARPEPGSRAARCRPSQQAWRGELRGGGQRVSRHYYDLHRMLATDLAAKAMADADLGRDCVRHARIFFNSLDLATAEPGSFVLRPTNARLDPLRRDYIAMTGLIFGDAPAFVAVITSIPVSPFRGSNPMHAGKDAPPSDPVSETAADKSRQNPRPVHTRIGSGLHRRGPVVRGGSLLRCVFRCRLPADLAAGQPIATRSRRATC